MRKILISGLIFICTLSVYGCSNKSSETKETTSTTVTSTTANKDENSSAKTSDEGIKKIYANYLENLKKEVAKYENLKPIAEKIENNIPKFMELHQKAKNTCSKDYSITQTITSSKNPNLKHEIKIKVSANGSSRSEETKDGKLLYLNIYSKDEDTNYTYELENDKLDKSTKYSLKNQGNYPYQYGYFSALSSNVTKADLKEIDYEGKKVTYGESAFESKDIDGKISKVIAKYWFDNNTGIILKEEEEQYTDNKLVATFKWDYKISFDETFDKNEFIFDKEKLKK